MLLADYEGLIRIGATPGVRATCPMCRTPVVPKCGKIVTWHWAHESTEECDPWAEPDTHWHSEWQGMWPPGAREIVMNTNGEMHRADVVAPNGTVVEFQHSSIGTDDIHAREHFYGRMIWIFDAIDAINGHRLLLRKRDGYWSFRWKHPRKSIAHCRKPVFLDLGNGDVLRLRKIHPTAPCGGWGHMTSRDQLITLLERR